MYIPPVLDSIVCTGTFTLSLDRTGLNREAITSVIVCRSGLGCKTNHVGFNNGVFQLFGVAVSVSEHVSRQGRTDSIDHWV